MKKFLILSFIGLALNVSAQNEFDVLRYSNIQYYGDARFNAMGGAFGALGANMSAISVNPGAIGVYSSSDMSFTPTFYYSYADSKTASGSVSDGRLNFQFSNVGLVGNFAGGGNWESGSFGFGYNRTGNFSSNVSIKNTTDNSMLSNYTSELNAFDGTYEGDIEGYYPFSSNLAYQTYLVNPIDGDSLKYSHVFEGQQNINQTTSYETRGGSGEVFFAMGGNYSDKLYLGMTMGIPTIRYIYDKTYTETVEEGDTLSDFRKFTMHDYVRTSGVGFNFKLGMIYRATDWFRLGMAFHTPTLYGMTDDYQSSIKSEMKDGTVFDYATPYGEYDYMMTTPYRFISSAAIIVGSNGVISGDYELVDYSTARLKHDNTFDVEGYDFATENENIRKNFAMAHNIRVGTEWRLDPFRIRAGYRFQGDPVRASLSGGNVANTYSVGAGIKDDDYYFDVAYALQKGSTETLVGGANGDVANTSFNNHLISFTLGFRF